MHPSRIQRQVRYRSIQGWETNPLLRAQLAVRAGWTHNPWCMRGWLVTAVSTDNGQTWHVSGK